MDTLTELMLEPTELPVRLGRYTLQEAIGRGGMGVVFRARTDDGAAVAVKVLARDVTANDMFRRRLQDEIDLAPRLNHPNIIEINEVGDAHGLVYLVMPLVEGPNLKEMLEHGRLAPEDAVRLLRPIADALDAAHAEGLVHCDVKPQNILVQENPRRPFITDFGLVRPVGAESTASRSREVFGSVQYMAPEQIEALAVDGRTDVYGLACVLFEAITGHIPFDRPNEIAVLWAHVNEPVPRVTDHDRRLPGGIDAALAKGMAKHPDDRYLTCGELIEAVEHGIQRAHRPLFLPTMRPLVERKRTRTEREVWSPNFFPELARVRAVSERPNWRRVGATVASICLAMAAAVQLGHPRGVAGAASDVVSAARSAGSDLVRAVSGGEDDVTLTSPAAARRVEAAKGRRAGDEVGTPARSAPPVAVTLPDTTTESDGGTGDASGPATRPRSTIVFTNKEGSNAEIVAVRPNGERAVNLTSNPAHDSAPALSPDGRRIVFWSNRFDGRGDLYVMNADGSDPRRLTPDAMYDTWPSWSPDGRWVTFASFPDPRCTPNCSVSSDLGDGDIRIASLDGSIVRTLASTHDNNHPDWSPDGKSIVFTRDGDLFTLQLDGSGFTRLTDTPGGEYDPEWSPDGRTVAYGYLGGIRLLNLKTGAVTEVTTPARGSQSPSWSPAGKRIVFASCTDARCNAHGLWIADVRTGDLTQLPAAGSTAYSPNWGSTRR